MNKKPILTLKRKHSASNDQIKTSNIVEQQQQKLADKQPAQPAQSVKTSNSKAKKQSLINNEDYSAILAYMQEHFPQCFAGKDILPLALGIHNQIFALGDLPFSLRKIRQFLQKYTHSKEYRKTLIAGNDRYDLHGRPTSKILEDEVYTRKSSQSKAQKKTDTINKANHDSLIKKAMENPVTAAEFFSEYLPAEFKNFIDLNTLKIEKESHVEDSLKTKFSDIVYAVKTKTKNQEESDTAFIYLLLEHQATPDYWIAFRLMKYSMLLLERHIKKRNKLPVIMQMVLYNGTVKYSAPKNLWQLFGNPELAKNSMGGDYNLIDLNAMSDDDIDYEKHLSFLLYSMKNIHDRDMLAMLKKVMQRCKQALIIDKGQDYVHTKLILWYTDSKVPVEKKQLLEQLIVDNLPKEDTENIMKTIADSYIEEGINQGIAIGEARGEARGEAKGVEIGATNKVFEIARRMLKEKTDINFISSVTGLASDEVLKLQNKM